MCTAAVCDSFMLCLRCGITWCYCSTLHMCRKWLANAPSCSVQALVSSGNTSIICFCFHSVFLWCVYLHEFSKVSGPSEPSWPLYWTILLVRANQHPKQKEYVKDSHQTCFKTCNINLCLMWVFPQKSSMVPWFQSLTSSCNQTRFNIYCSQWLLRSVKVSVVWTCLTFQCNTMNVLSEALSENVLYS